MKKIRFPKVLRTRWLKALESGRYQQTKLRLEDAGKHCCLGVLGRILRINRTQLRMYSLPAALSDSGKFPEAICQLEGGNTKFAMRLAGMNDRGETFKEIAKYIRKKTIGA